jgi:hypothetical protein
MEESTLPWTSVISARKHGSSGSSSTYPQMRKLQTFSPSLCLRKKKFVYFRDKFGMMQNVSLAEREC